MQGLEISYCSLTKWEIQWWKPDWLPEREMAWAHHGSHMCMNVCLLKSLRTVYISQVCRDGDKLKNTTHLGHLKTWDAYVKFNISVHTLKKKKKLHFFSRELEPYRNSLKKIESNCNVLWRCAQIIIYPFSQDLTALNFKQLIEWFIWTQLLTGMIVPCTLLSVFSCTSPVPLSILLCILLSFPSLLPIFPPSLLPSLPSGILYMFGKRTADHFFFLKWILIEYLLVTDLTKVFNSTWRQPFVLGPPRHVA